MLTSQLKWYAVARCQFKFKRGTCRNYNNILTKAGIQNGSQQQQQSKIDAVIVLAGGLCSDGSLPEWVSRRLDCAFDIYQKQNRSTRILLTGGGTPHKPAIIDNNGHVLHESTACAQYLLQKGVASSSMVKEVQSYDTIGNGYFSAMLHVYPAQWKTLSVVTSEFHMPRTVAIFNKIYSLLAMQQGLPQNWYELDFVSVSDDGIFPQEVLNARKTKEANSCQQFVKDMLEINNLVEFHAWMYNTHLCYSVSRQHEFGRIKPQNATVLASY